MKRESLAGFKMGEVRIGRMKCMVSISKGKAQESLVDY